MYTHIHTHTYTLKLGTCAWGTGEMAPSLKRLSHRLEDGVVTTSHMQRHFDKYLHPRYWAERGRLSSTAHGQIRLVSWWAPDSLREPQKLGWRIVEENTSVLHLHTHSHVCILTCTHSHMHTFTHKMHIINAQRDKNCKGNQCLLGLSLCSSSVHRIRSRSLTHPRLWLHREQHGQHDSDFTELLPDQRISSARKLSIKIKHYKIILMHTCGCGVQERIFGLHPILIWNFSSHVLLSNYPNTSEW